MLRVGFYAKCSVNFETFGGKDKKVSVKVSNMHEHMNSSMLSLIISPTLQPESERLKVKNL